MRICFINPPNERYSPISGGAVATVTMQSTRQLLRKGHSVDILTVVNDDETYAAGRVIPIQAKTREEIPAIPRKLAVLRSRASGWDWPYYQFYLNSFSQALRALTPTPDAVIVCNDLVSPQYIKRIVPKARVLVWLHNELGTRQKDLGAAFAGIDGFLTCSGYIRDWTVKRYGLTPEKFTVVHNGVDLEAFSPRPDFLEPTQTLRALFIGRIDPNKGPDIAVDAVGALRKEGLALSMTVAGGLWFYGHGKEMEDPYFRELKAKMEAADADYVGHVTRPNVPALIRSHDVAFVLSRSNEPFGLTVLEAMASGCAVIASDRGGLPEACGEAALMADPDNFEAVTESLRLLATRPEALRAQKQRAIERASRASWQASGETLERALLSVLAALATAWSRIGANELKLFHICTIVNNLEQYGEMKRSFLEAGFDEDLCRYTVFDNTTANRWDPYRTITAVLAEEHAEPYIIFCHQDLLLNQGDGAERLKDLLEDLQRRDAHWAIAGNAGGTDRLEIVSHITDPNGAFRAENLPRRVVTLDENFLVIKAGTPIGCSADLSGFHLYASDLCWNAMVKGYNAYVIDFRLMHLSGGNVDERFYAALDQLQKRWNPRFLGVYVRTTVLTFYLGRYAFARRLLRSQRVQKLVIRRPAVNALLLARRLPEKKATI